MTLQQRFDEYMANVYIDPVARNTMQYQQLRDAFFGGCLVAYTTTADYRDELHRYPTEIRAKIAAARSAQVN